MSDRIRVRIKSDGTLRNTVVTDADTGRPIICSAVSIDMRGGRQAVTLEVVDAVIEIEGEVELVTETKRIYQMPCRTATSE